ncbi:type II restriction enzyme methylase, partial [Candidatus Gastranaerophilus sp. (ex Termes propinquus)]
EMINLNKTLHEQTQRALELLQTEYKPKKISQKLEKFYTLGLNPFIEELEKQGVKLTLSQKEELIDWYKTKSTTLTAIKAQIETLDAAIDREVYTLFSLTAEEIAIVEGVE